MLLETPGRLTPPARTCSCTCTRTRTRTRTSASAAGPDDGDGDMPTNCAAAGCATTYDKHINISFHR